MASPSSDVWHGQKWVRVMCDYCADAVWNVHGQSCELIDLPVSDSLRSHLRAWQEFYDRHCPVPGSKSSGLWDVERFSLEGLKFARAVKSELPDWTVIYFDEHKLGLHPHGSPRELFEYEVGD